MILTRLLDKYENSRHLVEPGASNRRVMLRVDRGELPEYRYETAEIRDRFNLCARELTKEKLVELEWVPGRPVLSAVILNLNQIDRAYQVARRTHPVQAAAEIRALIQNMLSDVKTAWIQAWRDDTCQEIQRTLRCPPIGKQGSSYTRDVLRMLVCYDKLDGAAATMRAFSTLCFQNSKRFEREFQNEFLRIAARFHPELAEISSQEALGPREKLAFLGIYTRPELYLLSGHLSVVMKSGTIDLSPLFPHGFALPSSAVDEIISFDFQAINRITFIENMTNYDEYLHTEASPEELIIYHGGFLSPKKRQLLQKIASSMPCQIEVRLWADIDLGGFQMFTRLKEIFPNLKPMRMSAKDVSDHAAFGLARERTYLERLQTALGQQEFPFFEDAIRMILYHGITIEQEVFLMNSE